MASRQSKKSSLDLLKDRFRHLIRRELGLVRFKVLDNGDFQFRYEMAECRVRFDPDDPEFVWLVVGSIYCYPAHDQIADAAALKALNVANQQIKSIKLIRTKEPDEDGDYLVHVGIDMVLPNISSIDGAILEKYLARLKCGASQFFESLGATADPGDDEIAETDVQTDLEGTLH